MARYTVSRSNVALSTVNDLLTLIAAASRRLQIIEVSVGGMGTSSAANEVGLFRSTGGTTGSGALTPTKEGDTDEPNPSFTNFTAWSAQPSLSGDPVIRLPVNANGGIYRWVPRPGEESEIRNTEQLSLRGVVGSSNITFHIIVEET